MPFAVSRAKYEHSWAKIGVYEIGESNDVKFLDLPIYNKL